MYTQGSAGSSNLSGFSVSQPTAPQKVSPVLLELSSLATSVDDLHKVVNDLEIRLSAVLAPTPPTNSGAGGVQAATPEPHSLAQRISREAVATKYATQKLYAILERLEL